MATVVVTLLIITRFYVSKMDADSEERQRDRISRREKRWSMNSQRLEQIVAELMRPIGDLRHSFDTDLSALLEEYLTEAGLHALEAEGGFSPERGAGGGAGAGEGAGPLGGAPNFAELALLLQQSANIYGRKVDFLYQHVLAVSESLHLSTSELSQESESASPLAGSEGAGAGGARRRRRASAGGFARLALAACAGARRDPPPQPPPTLPRLFAELEPRVLGPADVPLLDYSGEPVGLLQDFHVAWRLDDGLLVEELDRGMGDAGSGGLRALCLAELQAAIEAAAPAARACSTPLPPEDPPPSLAPSPPASPLAAGAGAEGPQDSGAESPAEGSLELAARRKRRHGPDHLCDHSHKLYITPELRLLLRKEREFAVPEQWVSRVVQARRGRLLRMRASLKPLPTEFHGFQIDKADIGGFLGFSADAGAEAEVSVLLSRLAEAAQDSDDDGFFELSSLSSEGERRLSSPPPPPRSPPPAPASSASPAAWEAWRAGVVARAAAGEARGLDVRALGAAVLHALPGPAGGALETPFAHVLDTAATDDSDVSRLFLATLFLANSGNVEVVPGPPLSLNSFSLRLLSRDERRYCAAAAADPAFLAR